MDRYEVATRPSLRSRMSIRAPGTRKYDAETVAKLKGWLADGLSTADAESRLAEEGIRMTRNTIRDIAKGRTWATVEAKR